VSWGLVCLVLVAAGAGARDRGADGRYDERRSSHFILLQDVDIDQRSGWRGSRRFEREVLAVLEEARRELEARLGLELRRPVQVVVHDPAVFDERFAGRFRFPAGGFYRGSIQIRGDVQVSQMLERVLRHELVHAAFDAEAPAYALPGWINEGSAEYFEQRSLGKRHLDPRQYALLSEAAALGLRPTLHELSVPAFGQLQPQQAALAYTASYAAIAHLVRRRGEDRLASFLEDLLRIRNPDRALERNYRLDVDGLDAALAAELR
jgi:hypothetical protein